MPQAREVAAELRKLADALDISPELQMDQPSMYLHYYETNKQQYIDLVKILPRPLHKEYEDSEHGYLNIKYKSEGLAIRVSIPRIAVCEIVAPARGPIFKCIPLLSESEDAALITE